MNVENELNFLDCSRWSRDRWAIGVSGGRDSVALLHACIKSKITNLVIVHVNHQLRGLDSQKDEDFVKHLAVHYNLPLVSKKVDLSLYEGGMETAAREARLNVFMRAIHEHNCRGVLLAHHADDQIETLFLQILRGSYIPTGIRETSFIKIGNESLEIGRPLLSISRKKINNYVERNKIEFCEDPTNKEAITPRNRLRNEVFPLLEEIMSRDICPILTRVTANMQEIEEFIQAILEKENCYDPQGRIYVPALENASKVLQKECVVSYLKENDVSNITNDLIERSLLLFDSQKKVSKINLSKGRWLRRKEKRIFIE